MNTGLRTPLLGGASAFALSLLFLNSPAFAHGLPGHGHFADGQGSIAKSGGRLTINQNSQTGIIDWRSFSVGKANSVVFHNGGGATLNIVKGNNLSRIAGDLHANGSVYLINRAGVVVTGAGHIVTQGSFGASSRNADADSFSGNGRLRLTAGNKGHVVNRGVIDAAHHVSLASGYVNNRGTISAHGADLIAGRRMTVGGEVHAHGGVETSGSHLRFTGGTVFANRWTVDPMNLDVDSTAATSINSSLGAGTDVLLQTTDTTTTGPGNASSGPGDINIGADLSWSTGAKLTIDAWRSVNIAGTHIGVGGAGSLELDSAHGGTVSEFEGGDVTFANTTAALSINGQAYKLVKTLAGLANQIKKAPDGSFALADDVDASATTYTAAPIKTAFTGSFDGLGNVISDLTIKAAAGNADVGLFAELDKGGHIKNLNLTHAIVKGGTSGMAVGGLVGLAKGSLSDDSISGGGSVLSTKNGSDAGGMVGQLFGGKIINSQAVIKTTGVADAGGLVGNMNSHASVTFGTGEGLVKAGSGGNAGGLVGIMNNSTVKGSFASGNVTVGGAGAWGGGLVGEMDGKSKVATSHASGNSSGTGTGAGYGGLIGYLGPDSHDTVTNSYATGNETGGGNNTGNGGLIGFIDLNGNNTITQDYATGNAISSSGSNTNNGGLIGFIDTGTNNIARTYATGNASGGSGSSNGGLVGWNEGSIVDSYAMGAVSGPFYNGGLVGWNKGAGTIATSYSIGAVGNAQDAGGLVGFDTGATSTDMTTTYWDLDTSGISDTSKGVGNHSNHAGVSGIADGVLNSDVPIGFDHDVWGWNGGINNSYPYLLWAVTD